jgi:hypothetical protein
VGIIGLTRRLAQDRCFPQFFLKTNAWRCVLCCPITAPLSASDRACMSVSLCVPGHVCRGTNHVIILFFFAIITTM